MQNGVMYSRNINYLNNKSFFLFGPRGTGKSTWVKKEFGGAVFLNLLESALYTELLAEPSRIERYIPKDYKGWVVIDEVQKVPLLLDEVHRLIEDRGLTFVLTGSSARKLRQNGVNLLGGRALTKRMYPLSVKELGGDFSLEHSLKFGCLPSVYVEQAPDKYLASYVANYIKEEVQQEGLTRNLGAFTRFLESASFSQGSALNISEVARDCAIGRKVAEKYFSILEDLLLATCLPVFTKKARRRLVAHPKFYFFDTGVYRAIRPSGPLDLPEEIEGLALETLVYQQLLSVIAASDLDYQIYYWRTSNGEEVDFILYGKKKILAIEVKRAGKLRPKDFSGLRAFNSDYPSAECFLLYPGDRPYHEHGIEVVPVVKALTELDALLA
jgi:predicted AAA+ superfamily ATPase